MDTGGSWVGRCWGMEVALYAKGTELVCTNQLPLNLTFRRLYTHKMHYANDFKLGRVHESYQSQFLEFVL